MDAMAVGRKLVEMAKDRAGEAAFVDQYYDDAIVSIEGGGDDGEIQQRMEGIDAIRGKHEWWYGNNDVHGIEATGPYVGHRQDQFVVRFNMDLTPKGGERMQMEEVGLFTVRDGKVVQEEFLYLMG